MLRHDSRGVSDAVGFVLIFGLIMTSVGIIYATGFGNLEQTRSLEERGNVERAYEILGDNIEDVVRGDAPARSTQLKLGSNEIVSSEPIEITVRDTGNGTEIVNEEIYPIEYIVASSGDSVLYVNGATARDTTHGSTMIREPPIVSNDTDNPTSVILPIIRTQPVDAGIIGVSGGTVDVRTTSVGEVDQSFQPVGTVEYEIKTPRTDMWERYCARDNNPWNHVSTSSDSVVCELESSVNQVYIQYEYLDVELTT